MMPNKKNPDPAELVRGRAARVIGELTGVLATLKGLPLAYQRDLQESVAPLFDAVSVFEASLRVMAGLIETLEVDASRMRKAAGEGYTTATAVADTLVRRGVPFRTAHHIVGTLVAQAEGEGLGLDEVPDSMIGLALGASGDADAAALAAESGLGDDLRAAASLEGALASCDVVGGTAPGRVAAALADARARLDDAPTPADARVRPDETAALAGARGRLDDAATPADARARPDETAAPADARARPDETAAPADARARPDETAAPADARARPDEPAAPADARLRLDDDGASSDARARMDEPAPRSD